MLEFVDPLRTRDGQMYVAPPSDASALVLERAVGVPGALPLKGIEHGILGRSVVTKSPQFNDSSSLGR